MLAQLARGLQAIGVEPIRRKQLIVKVGFDCIPPNRSFLDPNAGRDFRGEAQKATTFVDDQGSIQHYAMLDETRRNLETGFHTFALSLQKQASDAAIADLTRQYDFEDRRVAGIETQRRAYRDETARLGQSTIAGAFAQQDVFLGTDRDRQLRVSEFAGILPARTLRPRGMDAGDFQRLQDQRQASNSLSQISGRSSIEQDYITKSSIADADTIKRGLEAALIDVDYARKSGRISDTDAADRVSALTKSAGQQGGALNARYPAEMLRSQQQAIIDGTKTIQELQNTQIEKVQAILDRQQESITSFGTGALNAAVSQRRNPTAMRDFLRNQAMSTVDTFAENALRTWVSPVVNGAIPKSASPLFKGTLFEKTPSILKASAGVPELHTAGLDLSAAARDLMNAARAMGMSRSGGGGGLPGIGGYDPSTGTYSSGLSSVLYGANVNPDGSDDIPLMNYGGLGTATGQAAAYGINTGSSGFGFNAGTVAGIAGAGAGAYQAIQGFKKGGAGGALSGASGALASTAAIASLIPGGQVVALAAGIASMATGIIGGLLNNPQKRATAISQELSQNQYIAPTALNVTQGLNGTYEDFDARGRLRTSSMSAVPTVSEPYIWQQTHGFLGGPPTYYDVPGGVKTPYSGSPGGSGQAPVSNTIIVNAIDTQSFAEAMMKHAPAVGAAVNSHLLGGGGEQLASTIRYHANS